MLGQVLCHGLLGRTNTVIFLRNIGCFHGFRCSVINGFSAGFLEEIIVQLLPFRVLAVGVVVALTIVMLSQVLTKGFLRRSGADAVVFADLGRVGILNIGIVTNRLPTGLNQILIIQTLPFRILAVGIKIFFSVIMITQVIIKGIIMLFCDLFRGTTGTAW